jgi:hypothetical protein
MSRDNIDIGVDGKSAIGLGLVGAGAYTGVKNEAKISRNLSRYGKAHKNKARYDRWADSAKNVSSAKKKLTIGQRLNPFTRRKNIINNLPGGAGKGSISVGSKLFSTKKINNMVSENARKSRLTSVLKGRIRNRTLKSIAVPTALVAGGIATLASKKKKQRRLA